ncbi:hypothetical protein GCM10011396_09500 [Undibacterium terreum]|uniref:Uncharacterized protein n=2 Tax=Undibacterium terreum TaxID=1224302 RepID=A0A916U9E9_9BURK|nr:hypothetical protein GCM10011396_09500 [Undibacterium terreum]
MKPLIIYIALAIASAGFAPDARADWSEASVAYKCDPAGNLFALHGVVQANDEFFIPKKPGYSVISDEEPSSLHCNIGKARITAIIEVSPPREKGMCASQALYSIRKLEVNGKEIMGYQLFNNICSFSGSSLFGVEISTKGKNINIKTCAGKWDWKPEYDDSKCESKIISLDKQ